MASKGRRAAAPASPPHSDDFTRIKDIGPDIANRLYKARIRTFAQLAALSLADIAALLRGVAGPSARRIAKEDWIGQARKLAAIRKRPPAKAHDKLASLSRRQHYATFTVELLLDEKNRVRRTQVVHIQNMKPDKWPGWEPDRLIGFFAEQAALRVPATRPSSRAAQRRPTTIEPGLAQETEAALPVPATEPISPHEPETKLRLDVGEVTTCEVPRAQAAGEPMFRKRLRAEITFRLSGTTAEQIAASQSRYSVQLLADEVTSHQMTILATGQGQLQPKLLNYAMTLEFPLPDLGRYQLFGMVAFPDQAIVGISSRSVINVVP